MADYSELACSSMPSSSTSSGLHSLGFLGPKKLTGVSHLRPRWSIATRSNVTPPAAEAAAAAAELANGHCQSGLQRPTRRLLSPRWLPSKVHRATDAANPSKHAGRSTGKALTRGCSTNRGDRCTSTGCHSSLLAATVGGAELPSMQVAAAAAAPSPAHQPAPSPAAAAAAA
eukprot:CAMPEP_0172830198 /NCGR_PEP_ID=MMETSP1075-20121228/22070_1 /TAXON_ID=2916 /ORGANISM="Ceratium fusus, Strain PA161109" /LENGTH=171 /DNA_ID=CAMNT_0013672451 /DNA_START=1145 /DNA_END=1658 /DNA_ORIENTATION=-